MFDDSIQQHVLEHRYRFPLMALNIRHFNPDFMTGRCPLLLALHTGIYSIDLRRPHASVNKSLVERGIRPVHLAPKEHHRMRNGIKRVLLAFIILHTPYTSNRLNPPIHMLNIQQVLRQQRPIPFSYLKPSLR